VVETGAGEEFHLYAAGDDSALGVYDHGDDAYVTYVATRPEARGRGLASGLLAVALLEARERNQAISSLHATKAGAPVYARLGYESAGAVQMWEKRR
jgi:predicted acetyltransferase